MWRHVPERLGRLSPVGYLRRGAGNRDIDYRDFPGRGAAVPGGLSADCLRLRMLQAVNSFT